MRKQDITIREEMSTQVIKKTLKLQKILDETKNQEGIIDLNKSNPTFIPKSIT